MLLDIRNELQTIRDEVVLMDRVRYKLASQMRQFKEFN